MGRCDPYFLDSSHQTQLSGSTKRELGYNKDEDGHKLIGICSSNLAVIARLKSSWVVARWLFKHHIPVRQCRQYGRSQRCHHQRMQLVELLKTTYSTTWYRTERLSSLAQRIQHCTQMTLGWMKMGRGVGEPRNTSTTTSGEGTWGCQRLISESRFCSFPSLWLIAH